MRNPSIPAYLAAVIALPCALAAGAVGGSSEELNPAPARSGEAPPPILGDPPPGGAKAEDYAPLPTKGAFDCPTVAPPPYRGSIAANVALSPQFQAVCATCHGRSGQGSGRYPAIANVPVAAFIAAVRSGRGSMPPFSADYVSDDVLRADAAILAKGALPATNSALAWTPAQVEQAHQEGLKAWRKPDAKGAACTNCHNTPDAIDLAMIGYSDATIFRRALMHLDAVDADKIRNMVHAQRRRLEITAPCDPFEWRPFQPGGKPLPGATLDDQDAAFATYLEKEAKLRLTGDSISTLEDAQLAFKELATLNLKRLPMATPLPRWTEDKFNSDEHRSVNDWITSVPRVPADGKWYERFDAYLANPTDDAMWALVKDLPTLTKPGHASSVVWNDPWTKQPATMTDGGGLGEVLRNKAGAALIASHFFRLELTKKKGWFELPDIPLPQADFAVDLMRRIGPTFQEDHCYVTVRAWT